MRSRGGAWAVGTWAQLLDALFAMALSCLRGVELALFAAAFLCGAMAAVTPCHVPQPHPSVTLWLGFLASWPSTASCDHSSGSSAAGWGPSTGECPTVKTRGLRWANCIPATRLGLFLRSAVVSYIALGISATATFLLLASACILHFGTSSLCSSIISLHRTNR